MLTTAASRGSLPPGRAEAVEIDRDWAGIAAAAEEAGEEPAPILPDQLAYLVYTSGSTGRPKAVGNGHRQILS